MESVADDIGPEAAVRPPARKPGSVPATAEHPVAGAAPAEPAWTPAPATAPQPSRPTHLPDAPKAGLGNATHRSICGHIGNTRRGGALSS